jgi:hypothetical protein
MTNAAMSRDDMKPRTDTHDFDQLSAEVQKVLKRAASRGAANSTPEIFAAVGRDWLMVPSKRGLRQVVVTAERAFAL